MADRSMDPPEKRRKKKDKAREKEARNGKYSSKHVRMFETKPKSPVTKLVGRVGHIVSDT